ncbi:MAG TPA: hypothetical protein VGB53_00845 [Rubricoccaceae bacterium]|jgi:hypothetical protein
MPDPYPFAAAGVPTQELLDAVEDALADSVKYRSSAPGTQLADGTVLVGGGIAELAAAALADIGAAGGVQVVVVTSAGGVQVAAVNAARAGAVTTISTLVAQAQAFRNDAMNVGAMLTFNGWKGQHNTKAALIAAGGKLDGYHVVLVDETNDNVPWAYPVTGGTVSGAGFGVPLLNAARGLDLVGPLVLNAARTAGGLFARLDVPASETADGVPAFGISYASAANPDGTGRDNYVSLGWNVLGGPAHGMTNGPFSRIVFEEQYRPGSGMTWIEPYLELRGATGPIRRPWFVVYNSGAGRAGSFQILGDSISFKDGGEVEKLGYYGGSWNLAPNTTLIIRGQGSKLSQFSDDESIQSNLIGLSYIPDTFYETWPVVIALGATAATPVRFFDASLGPTFFPDDGGGPAFNLRGGKRLNTGWRVSIGAEEDGHLLGLTDYGIYGGDYANGGSQEGYGIGLGVKSGEMRVVNRHQTLRTVFGHGSYAGFVETAYLKGSGGGTMELMGIAGSEVASEYVGRSASGARRKLVVPEAAGTPAVWVAA